MPFFRIVDCKHFSKHFFAEYFCHLVGLPNVILRNGKLPNGKIAEGCCGMTYSHFSLEKNLEKTSLGSSPSATSILVTDVGDGDNFEILVTYKRLW